MKTTSSFYLVSKSLDKVFRGRYNQLRQLIEYMELYSFWKFQKKLQKDGSFYCSDSFLAQKLNLARGTIIKNRKELKEKGFIDFTTNLQKGSATHIFINASKIEEIQNSNEDIGSINDLEAQDIEDEIQGQPEILQESIEETSVVAKNATVEKEVGKTELAIVEAKAPIEDAMSYKQRIITAWNTIASRYETTPSIAIVTDTRLKKFKNILKFANIDERQFFNAINKALSESKFLRGIGKKWRANFDFFLNQNSFLKVIEGAYKDNPNEIMEILQDPAKMSFKEAQELREKIEMERWLHDEEKEEPKALP